MKIDVITIFPESLSSPLKTGLLGKAIETGLLEVKVHDLRRWGMGPHRKVDDEPFGGGAGMVMAPGPAVEAVEELRRPGSRVILMAAAGEPLTQPKVREFHQSGDLVVVCGRYEGMDDRIREVLGAEEVSIGEFVLHGGETAAMCLIEATSRLIPGVLGNAASLDEESFGSGLVEYPHYTRPAEYRGVAVPEVLLSGNHAAIAKWRREQSLLRTLKARPQYLDAYEMTEGEQALIEKSRR